MRSRSHRKLGSRKRMSMRICPISPEPSPLSVKTSSSYLQAAWIVGTFFRTGNVLPAPDAAPSAGAPTLKDRPLRFVNLDRYSLFGYAARFVFCLSVALFLTITVPRNPIRARLEPRPATLNRLPEIESLNAFE